MHFNNEFRLISIFLTTSKSIIYSDKDWAYKYHLASYKYYELKVLCFDSNLYFCGNLALYYV